MTRATLAFLLVAAVGTAACSTPTGVPTAMTAPGTTTAPEPRDPTPAAPPTAQYRLVFTSTWTAATHPQDFPGNPHYSPLIGGTHHSGVTFWQSGALATEGIRRMAEIGSPRTLEEEIRVGIGAGTAQHVFVAGNLDSPGATSFEFEVSQGHPLVTLVTMVAPSPDWFVGVSGLPLFENGAWTEQRVIELRPWDAGTDSGVTFRAEDQETRPRQPISLISTPPLAVGGAVTPLGTFTFTRIAS
jgi:hypothetical protein